MQTPKFQLAMEGHLEQALRVDRRIGLEAGFLTNFATTLREGVPRLLDSVTSALRSAELPQDSKSVINPHRAQFLNMITKHNYVHLSDIAVYVPEGFVGNLAQYSACLLECSEHASKVTGDVITPYNTFLSMMLSSSNARLSSFGELGYLSKIDAEREKLNKQVGSFFRESSTASKLPMGKVISRNADWDTVLQTMPKVYDMIGQVKREVVQRHVDDCLELIEAVKHNATNGNMDNLSGPMIKQLSQATLSVAREVEFYSVTAFRIEVLNKAVEDSIEHLTKALK